MVALGGRERLQPSLLDRLTDNAPAAKRDGPDQQTLSMTQLRQAVLRDLAWLFNTTNLDSLDSLETAPNVAKSTLNYGIPGLAGLLESGSRTRRLEEELTEAVRRFEPRIRSDTVKVRVRGADDSDGMRALVFEVEGELWAQPVPVRLFVETKIEVETRTAVVTEVRARTSNDGS